MADTAKKKRNAKGDGSLKFDEKKQKWVARITAHKADGTAYRKTFEGKTQGEARKKRDEWKNLHYDIPEGKHEKAYLSDYIMDWLQTVKKGSIKPTSYERYLRAINKHILPYIGHIRLINLDTLTIQREIINCMRDEKDKDGKPSQSYSNIKKVYNPLNSCLKYAIKVGDIASNPCDNITLPKERKATAKKIHPLSDEEARRFLSVCTEDVSKHWWSYCIMLYTGLREGEIGALRPADIHLDSNYIDVHATIVANIDPETGKRASGFVYQNSTKTSKDRRAYFGEAAKVLLTERLKSCPEDCYLANQSRTPVNLVYLGRAFKKVLTYADIENDCTLHDLRHTCATRLIRQGTDVKSVSLQLGHANIQTTLNIYVHPSEEDRARAMLNLHW